MVSNTLAFAAQQQQQRRQQQQQQQMQQQMQIHKQNNNSSNQQPDASGQRLQTTTTIRVVATDLSQVINGVVGHTTNGLTSPSISPLALSPPLPTPSPRFNSYYNCEPEPETEPKFDTNSDTSRLVISARDHHHPSSHIDRCQPATTEKILQQPVDSQMVHPLSKGSFVTTGSQLDDRKHHQQPDQVPAMGANNLSSHHINGGDSFAISNNNDDDDKTLVVDDVPNEQQQQSTMTLNNHDQQNSQTVAGSPPLRPADRESAKRLAERLYNLNGFKKTDVCHHLAKNNPFGQLVAEEYLKHFDFRMMKLDAALRKFLSMFQLSGETQERERVFSHFSRHYYECNSEKFPNPEAVQTLVCALILLNTDIHSDKRSRFTPKRPKLSLVSFIEGLNSSIKDQQQQLLLATRTAYLSDCNTNLRPQDTTDNAGGYTFPRHMLVDLYESVKKRPFECGTNADNCDLTTFESELDKIYQQQQQQQQQVASSSNGKASSRSSTLPSRRYAPGVNSSSFKTMSPSSRRLFKRNLGRMNSSICGEECLIQFKSGQVNRKRIFEPNSKPTPKGRRSWRRTNMILQDLRLIMRFGSDMSIIIAKDGLVGANNSDDISEEKTIAETKEAATTDDQTPHVDTSQKQREEKEEVNQSKVSKSAPNSPSKRRLSKVLASDLRNTIRVHHAYAKVSTSYTKRPFVFHLKLANQSELLIEANDGQDLDLWVQTINFAAACLSSPALPSAISNSRSQPSCLQRPLLPSGYTKLSYWEQLLDHEERLKRLKIELDEHLAEAANTKNAKRKDQTEFIEKIAYLRHDIERYTTYIDLMRKRSNSPEAILLSKRPQTFN